MDGNTEKKAEKMRKVVMVAIDETQSSYHALVWVLNNLKDDIAANNWSLILFSVPYLSHHNFAVAASLGYAQLHFHGLAAPDLQYLAQQSKKVCFGILEKAKSICSSQGIDAETVVGAGGDLKIAICSAVEEHNVELLIVGNENYGTLKRILMAMEGSVSKYCLDNAKCPVLVVKKKPTQTMCV